MIEWFDSMSPGVQSFVGVMLIFVGVVYAFLTAGYFIDGLDLYRNPSFSDYRKRKGARLVLLSPIWPTFFVWSAVVAVVKLIATAFKPLPDTKY